VTGSAEDDQRALVTLIQNAPGDAERQILYAGINDAFEGRPLGKLIPDLAALLAKSGNADLAARAGDKAALAAAIRSIGDDDPKLKDRRIKTIELLGQVGPAEAAPALLDVALKSQWHSVRRAALAALVHFNDPAIGRSIIAGYDKLPKDQAVRPAAISTLLSRKPWTLDLLQAIETGRIDKSDLAPDQLQRLRQSDDRAIAALMGKLFGQPAKPTSQQKEHEIARIRAIVTAAPGDAKRGKELFTARCAVCHTLFREGGAVGPDLTPYERRNVDFLLANIVDPSAAIREEYANFRIDTTDDQTFIGLVTERAADHLTITDATGQRTILPKGDIKEERALALSIMPEGLLDGMSDPQLRDFFAYLQASKP
jgi:putative heme-binding domain-containing protein